MISYNPHKWLDHLFDIQGSMVREILGRVSTCAAWSVVVVVFHKYVYSLAIPPVAHTLIGVVIGLLLVFRTNASYDRFWEGRKLWGAIVNDCRNLGRSCVVLLDGDHATRDEAIKWVAAFPYATKYRLRIESGFDATAAGLTPAENAEIAESEHPALATAVRLTTVLNRARRQGLVSDFLYGGLDAAVQRLIDSLGGCERIHSTPLPFVYVVHLRRALILYCGSLPLIFVDPFGWEAIVVTFVIAYMFFGIEEIGVEIEDPFGQDLNDLPLQVYCDRIERTLHCLAADTPPEKRVVLVGEGEYEG